jgi:hypothetical protein
MMTRGQAILLAEFNKDRESQLDISQYHLFNILSVKHNKYIYNHKKSVIDEANKLDESDDYKLR